METNAQRTCNIDFTRSVYKSYPAGNKPGPLQRTPSKEILLTSREPLVEGALHSALETQVQKNHFLFFFGGKAG
jgi:hypothetical protein